MSAASLFFGAFTRVLTGAATIWVSGYCLSAAKPSSGVLVSVLTRRNKEL